MKVEVGKIYRLNKNINRVGNHFPNDLRVYVWGRDEESQSEWQVGYGDFKFWVGSEDLKPDEPSKPAHYDTGIDTIAFMRANCTPEQVEGFLRGNVFKYLQRYDKKNGVEDLKKATHYVQMLIEEVEGRG